MKYRILNRINNRTSTPNSRMAVFDIRDYGAVVDGVTNDAAAVQAAFDAANTNGGGVIYFPAGVTRISTPCDLISGGFQRSFLLTGESGRSIVNFYRGGADRLLYMGSATNITISDIMFTGEDDGDMSAATYENNGPVIIIANVKKAVVERCGFMGIGTYNDGAYGTGGVLHFSECRTVVKDCVFGACCSTGGAVIFLDKSYGATLENLFFPDYHQFNGIYYSKLSVLGNTKSWIRTGTPQSANGGAIRPTYVIRNCGFDENNMDGLINLTGNSTQTVIVEGCGVASGFGGEAAQPAMQFTGFRRVVVKDSFIGLSLNTADHSAGTFTDVGDVQLDNVIMEYGAKFFTSAGTTKRVKIRNSSLQGNGTYPLGVNNTANALIDSDFGMPATASASALAPRGLTTHVTGTTTITSITATNLKPGDVLTLIFDSTAAINDGNNLVLAGNFTGDANRVLVLRYDGTNFYEQSRSTN